MSESVDPANTSLEIQKKYELSSVSLFFRGCQRLLVANEFVPPPHRPFGMFPRIGTLKVLSLKQQRTNPYHVDDFWHAVICVRGLLPMLRLILLT